MTLGIIYTKMESLVAAQTETWRMKGDLIGACSCDWGCPCSFDAPPTNHWCHGTYVWHIQEGSFEGISLDGLTVSWSGESPGPLHLGHVTGQKVIDSQADSGQRAALIKIMSGQIGGPFAIFASVTETELDPIFAPFVVTIDGLSSQVSAPGALEVTLTTIKNPVTGEPEELTLLKPTGFTAQESQLGSSEVYRFTGGIKHDHSGKYGEFSPFQYSWP